MGDDTRRFSGLVLLREPAGERHLRLTLLDPEEGLVRCLYKPAAKSGAPTVTPDLFDACEATLDAPKAGDNARFVREYRLVKRLDALGRDYARLALACRFATLLAKNPHPPESFAGLHALATGAFTAFAEKPFPEAAYFKTLWLVARDEGWPVKEHFFPSLRAGERELAARLLATPLAGLSSDDAPKAATEGLSRALEQWLAREAHYVV